ncbi:MAG: hypothetical protein IJU26_09085 [Synergistaceae bacterium]|nr:hypothetical protein [Synergistaceae bacterium]
MRNTLYGRELHAEGRNGMLNTVCELMHSPGSTPEQINAVKAELNS